METKLIGNKKAVVVKIPNDLDHHQAQYIRKNTDSKIKSTNAVNVIFDFTDVEFMDSSGIGLIMGRYKITKILGGKMYICGMGKQVQRIIKMSGIDKIVKTTVTVDEALSQI